MIVPTTDWNPRIVALKRYLPGPTCLKRNFPSLLVVVETIDPDSPGPRNSRSIPTAGDFFEWGGWRFEVVDMDRRRVDKVLVSRAGPVVQKAS